MSNFVDDAWSWLKTAPLPVVLAITVALGGWVYSIASDVTEVRRDAATEKAKADGVRQTVDKIDSKVDRLLDAVAELKAEQRVRDSLPPPSAPSPTPTPKPRKEK